MKTKTTYEVLIVRPSAGLTIRIGVLDNQKDAEKEARRLHSRDQYHPYKVIEVVKNCVYEIKGE